MGVLPDWMIEAGVKIEPFAPQQHRPGVISYGVTSYGYDVRVDRRFKVFTNVWGSTVDPKHFDPKSFVDLEADTCIIPPNSFALAETVEYMEIPREVIGICVGKSTYARCGIIPIVPHLEPEWWYCVTIEISNSTPARPIKGEVSGSLQTRLAVCGERIGCATFTAWREATETLRGKFGSGFMACADWKAKMSGQDECGLHTISEFEYNSDQLCPNAT